MKNIKTYKLSFLILQCLLSGTDLLSFVTDLPETPLGFYHQSPRFKTSYQVNSLDLPEEHHLIMTPVKDQGPIGTCVSFATSACGEFIYDSRSYRARFSEAEFTILAETEDSTEPYSCKSGLFLGNALIMAHKYGFVEEYKLPYDRYLRYVARKNGINPSLRNWKSLLGQSEAADICVILDYNATMGEIPADISFSGTSEDITPYRLTNLYPIHHVSRSDLGRTLRSTQYTYSSHHTLGTPANTDIDKIKQFLHLNYPVAIAVPVFEDCWQNNGEIDMPDGHQGIGSHAVIISGYDDENELFTIKNSWGRNVGDDGFYEMPYEYTKTYALEAIAVGR